MKPQNKTPEKNIDKLPYEVFELVSKANNVKDRVKILQDNSTFYLRTILQANFNPNILFDLPDGAPPYTPDPMPAGKQVSHINRVIKNLKFLVKGGSRLNRFQKESKFIKVLETLHAEDAKVFIDMKDKNLSKSWKGLTEATVRKAFPALLPHIEK